MQQSNESSEVSRNEEPQERTVTLLAMPLFMTESFDGTIETEGEFIVAAEGLTPEIAAKIIRRFDQHKYECPLMAWDERIELPNSIQASMVFANDRGIAIPSQLQRLIRKTLRDHLR